MIEQEFGQRIGTAVLAGQPDGTNHLALARIHRRVGQKSSSGQADGTIFLALPGSSRRVSGPIPILPGLDSHFRQEDLQLANHFDHLHA